MFQPAAAQDADPPAAAWTAALLGLAVDDDEGGVNEPHLTTALGGTVPDSGQRNRPPAGP